MKHTDIDQVLEPSAPYGMEFTYADYLTWRFDEMVEIIRGKVFRMSPAPGSLHQVIAGNLHGIVWQHQKGKSCQVFIAPFDVVLPVANKKRESSTTVVQPDIFVVCNPSLIEERGCFGAPDLIIEVISPHTSKKDIQLKYDVYEEADVAEYWIVFPKSQTVEIFDLLNGKYNRRGMYVFEDTISSPLLPGLEIVLSDVFDEKYEY